MAVGDAGEDRDHLLVAFERVDVDGAAAAGKRRHAGVADEILDAGFGEHVGQFLLRHPQRLDAEEPVEQPLDVGVGGRDVIAIAGQRLQLALLALQPSPERVADQRRGRRAGRHRQQRAVVGRGLMRQQRHRVRQIAPAQRLLVQRQHVGLGIVRDSAATSASRSARVAPAAKSLSHSAMLKVACLPPMKLASANAVLVPERERQQQQRPALGIERRSR